MNVKYITPTYKVTPASISLIVEEKATEIPIESRSPVANTTILTLLDLNLDFRVRKIVVEITKIPAPIAVTAYHVDIWIRQVTMLVSAQPMLLIRNV